jgi:hypothetical protein
MTSMSGEPLHKESCEARRLRATGLDFQKSGSAAIQASAGSSTAAGPLESPTPAQLVRRCARPPNDCRLTQRRTVRHRTTQNGSHGLALVLSDADDEETRTVDSPSSAAAQVWPILGKVVVSARLNPSLRLSVSRIRAHLLRVGAELAQSYPQLWECRPLRQERVEAPRAVG